MIDGSLADVEAMARVVRIYMDALAEIAAHAASPDTPLGIIQAYDAPLRALIALRDASAIMEERIPHGRLEPWER